MKTARFVTNTPALLNEVLTSPGASVLHIPLQILAHQLGQVATRAAELNDPVLNSLMCDLALYEIADPYSKEYAPDRVAKIHAEAGRPR